MPRNEAGQIKAQTVDLLYAAEEPTMRQDFEGKEVELIGQFMPAKSNNPERGSIQPRAHVRDVLRRRCSSRGRNRPGPPSRKTFRK